MSTSKQMNQTKQVDRVEGTAIPLRGSNIDTDRIIPARFLKSITFEGLGEHAFEDDRQSIPNHPFANSAFRAASILLVNENFGSGSSREHAPQSLKRWGIRACVGESFSDIFKSNTLAIGLPCATATADDIEFLMAIAEQVPSTTMEFRVETLVLQAADRSVILDIPPGIRESLLTGQWDATGLLLDRFNEVRTVAAGLPYVKGF